LSEPVLIERRKLFEQVAKHLEREILTGALKPGDRLPPERDLQVKFGVGRPAIREALITLERSGLIEIGNGAPARVASPTMHGVVSGMVPAVQQMLATAEGQRHLQGVRLFMEIGLVRHIPRFIQTDVAFHYCLASIMRNPAFLALHDAMSTWLYDQRRVALTEPGEDRRGYEAHARIFEAVRGRDPDIAEAAMRSHLEEGWVAFWSRYSEK
jgi:DNA-binding FadR family transcriptional regulator